VQKVYTTSATKRPTVSKTAE